MAKSKKKNVFTVKSPVEVIMPNGKVKTLVPGVEYLNMPKEVKDQV